MASYQKYINSTANPSETNNTDWLWETSDLSNNIGPKGGKWMFFFGWDSVDSVWNKLKHLFRSGKLPGVVTMKVGANLGGYGTPILLYSGPWDDAEYIFQVGRNILKVFPFMRTFSYKSDEQTLYGTVNGKPFKHKTLYLLKYNKKTKTHTEFRNWSGEGDRSAKNPKILCSSTNSTG